MYIMFFSPSIKFIEIWRNCICCFSWPLHLNLVSELFAQIRHHTPVNLCVIHGVHTAVNVYLSTRSAILYFLHLLFLRTTETLTRNIFLQVCSGDTRTTSSWGQGQRVKGSNLQFGTGIATFTNGKYDSGHTAIYVGQSATGIDVWDQWVGQPVHQRTLRFDSTSYQNDGDNFYVIV